MKNAEAAQLLDDLLQRLNAIDGEAFDATLDHPTKRSEYIRDELLSDVRGFVRRNMLQIRDIQNRLLDESFDNYSMDDQCPVDPDAIYDSPWEALWSERHTPVVGYLLELAGKGFTHRPECAALAYLKELVVQMKAALPDDDPEPSTESSAVGDLTDRMERVETAIESDASEAVAKQKLTDLENQALCAAEKHKGTVTGVARSMLKRLTKQSMSYGELSQAGTGVLGTVQNLGAKLMKIGFISAEQGVGATKNRQLTDLGRAYLRAAGITHTRDPK